VFEIGTSLREARLRQGLDFPELEQATKIRGKYLRALEDEEFDTLPAETYVKGFLRSYAEYLGLDGQLYVDEFNSRYVTGEEEPPLRTRHRVSQHPRRTVESRAVILTLLGIAAVAALVIVAWKSGGAPKQNIAGIGGKRPVVQAHSGVKAHTVRRSKPRLARVVIVATSGSAPVEVRRGGPHGRLLYRSWLVPGERLVRRASTLWVQAGRPANLRAIVNGRTRLLPATGTVVLLVTARGVRQLAAT
jgi:cytoskeleton protein RodZ